MSQTETTSVERRLAAILAADVVGYSRLMEVDEAGTLARLKTIRLELIDPAIAKCKGRIIKTTGDGMLVEFQSVTEALRCAVDFQERMARRNRDMPASRVLVYRIGINLGDVIVGGRRYLWRRRQHCRAARIDSGTGRHLHFRGGARSGRRPARGRLRGSRRAAGQEHQPADPYLQGGAQRRHRSGERSRLRQPARGSARGEPCASRRSRCCRSST